MRSVSPSSWEKNVAKSWQQAEESNRDYAEKISRAEQLATSQERKIQEHTTQTRHGAGRRGVRVEHATQIPLLLLFFRKFEEM